jgi:hypothetical protein
MNVNKNIELTPLQYTGIYASALVGLITFAILIIVGRGWCDGKSDTIKIKKKDCCKGTWENFNSSVPLTIFIFTFIALILAAVFVYLGKNMQ